MDNEEHDSKSTNQLLKIVLALLGIAALGFVLALIFADRGNDSVSNVVTPIIKVVDPDYKSPEYVTVAGTVSFTGSVPHDSTVSVYKKGKDDLNSVVIATEIPARNGASFEWNQAIAGDEYDISASLDFRGVGLASVVQNGVVAPSEVNLVIQYDLLPPPPEGSIQIACDTQGGNGLYQASYTYNKNNPSTSALRYWLGAVTSQSSDETVFEVITQPASPDTTQSYQTDFVFREGITYFGSYAYSDCTNCTRFSDLSEWVEFKCSPKPTPTDALTPQ